MSCTGFKHFSHEHILYSDLLFKILRKRSVCDMCNHDIIGPFSSIYYCKESDVYVIHQTCGDLPQHMDHQLHQNHRLTLVITNSYDSISTSPTFGANTCCYYCDLPFEKYEPLYYKCDNCHDLYMHAKCANIPLPSITTTSGASDDKDHELVRFLCHEKSMALLQHDGTGRKHQGEKCFTCRLLWLDLPTFSCESQTCNHFLHKSCGESLLRRRQHPFHPQHPLTLQVSKPPYCDSCWKKDLRLIFSCVEDGCNNNINLCTKCACLDKHIYCQSHDHSLSLVEVNFASPNARGIRCDSCQKEHKKCREVDATQSYLFRCMECDFNYHFLCGPLPVRLKYEYHIHPLTLVGHSVTKDDSDEYYCDVCEEERDPQCRLYYCASCKYNAHIHCLLQEIIKVIKGDTENVGLCALGENRWNRLHIELKDHHTRTLRDLMDSLTKQEKTKFTNPFRLNYQKKLRLRQLYNVSREDSSHIEREGSIEDVDWVQQLFHFDYSPFCSLINYRFMLFNLVEGLKVDDKYLKQELIDVNSYKVPKTLAPILQTLLAKLGDLDDHHSGWGLSLTSAMKSVAATILCGVIDRMCKANFEDITLDVLEQLHSDLIGVTYMAGFKEIISQDSFDRLLLQAFPGLKAIKVEKDLSEKLQFEIQELEAKLKVCKENQLKLKKYKSEASDSMKESMRKAAELMNKKLADIWFPY